jgi:hypothetical protein
MIRQSRFDDINERYAKFLGRGFLEPGKSNIKKEYIKDLPVMIKDDGTIVCIPKIAEMGSICCVGQSGCLSGDTLIKVNRGEGCRTYPLHRFYKNYKGLFSNWRKNFDLSIPSFIRSFNGEEIRLNKIKSVIYSGKKEVYKLTLENGLSIKATKEHKFMTRDNGWMELQNLKDKEIMCDTLNPEKCKRKRLKLRDISLSVGKNHPNNLQPNRKISVHTLIYEASINNLSFLDYLDILLNEPERCKKLNYINPETHIIHHKDGCHYNNSIDNLELLPKNEHYLKHNLYTNFSQGSPKFSKVLNIEYVAEEDTYDIECEAPHHNFVANGIVVHNSGKTLLAGYMLSNLFYLWEDNISVLNDSQDETFDWSEPCDYPEFIFNLRKINQSPFPLPMIYILPNSDKFDINPNLIKNKNYVKVSIPFQEVINNIEQYIPNLGNSEKYLMEKKEELLQVKTEEELFDIIDSIDSGSKGMDTVRNKIMASFKALLNEGILNLSNMTSPCYLSVDKYTGNPFIAIMLANCIPSFITSDLYTQKYKGAIFSYYINQLFEASKSGIMKGKRTWLYFDELTKVVHSNPIYSCPQAEKALTNISSRGRNNSISMIYSTQKYGEIPKGMRDQTPYTFAFRHKNTEETKSIQEDFGVDKVQRMNILKLKKYECVALTTNYFVCYKDNKRWEERDPIKGRIFQPLHKNRFLHKKIEENKLQEG